MLHDTPLREAHQQYLAARTEKPAAAGTTDRPGAARAESVQPVELEYLPYGPADQQETTCELVATFGEVEGEYAAIRRGAGLMDCPHRGTLLVTGADRQSFLNNMLTNDLGNLEAGMTRSAFWLNRKGRIDADLVLVEAGDRLLIDVDVHQAEATAASLSEFIFTEDVIIKDISDDMHRIAVCGPRALELVADASGDESFMLGSSCAAQAVIAGHDVMVVRHDQTGEVALDLFVGYDNATAVWNDLLKRSERFGEDAKYIRPVGWYAYNIARIEAGSPLFNIDFGPTNLPHETGIVHDRVNFAKGCYRGQEIVARMENLGKPKQMLTGLRVDGELLPVAGGQVFAKAEDGSMGDAIGAVTSSTLSPMLGAVPIAFAMLKSDYTDSGKEILVNAEGEQLPATTHELRFLPTKEPA